MEDLGRYLQKKSYDVINLDYPSTDYTLEQLTNLTQKKLSAKLTQDKPVHFVGYAMGGLLVRAIIHKHKPKKLGRVVLLAPPNNGSEIADCLKENGLYQKIYDPAGQDLTTDKDITELFGQIDYELGVIAGNSTIDLISSAIIPGDDDGKVSIKSTKLEGMKDHIVVSASHTFVPSNRAVHQQTEYFLKHGIFKKGSGK
ncbi:MAG TPA: lipase [Gammaproteobacteria bacterium]|nr:lipase [Gammaproteobacteria bacterium]